MSHTMSHAMSHTMSHTRSTSTHLSSKIFGAQKIGTACFRTNVFLWFITQLNGFDISADFKRVAMMEGRISTLFLDNRPMTMNHRRLCK